MVRKRSTEVLPVSEPESGLEPESPFLFQNGDPDAQLVFCCAAPLEGEALRLLEKMVEALGLTLAKVLQVGLGVEGARESALQRLATVQPRVAVELKEQGRGQSEWVQGLRTLTSWHPSVLLQRPELKREAWEDLQAVAKELGIVIPKRGGTSR
jgi:uracil-DNA glycosylase